MRIPYHVDISHTEHACAVNKIVGNVGLLGVAASGKRVTNCSGLGVAAWLDSYLHDQEIRSRGVGSNDSRSIH